MKKIIALLSFMTLMTLWNISHAQTPGLWGVIYEDKTTTIASASPVNLINQISFDIIQIHLMIAGENIQWTEYESQLLSITKQVEELTKTNIISILELSDDKQKALQTYITDTQDALQKWDMLMIYSRQDLNIIQSDLKACTVEKNMADKAYFDGLNTYNQTDMDTALQTVVQNDTCISQKRIEYNAKLAIVNKLAVYLGFLQDKYNIIFAKQDLIVNHFDVIKNDILAQLNEINQVLNRYNF